MFRVISAGGFPFRARTHTYTQLLSTLPRIGYRRGLLFLAATATTEATIVKKT